MEWDTEIVDLACVPFYLFVGKNGKITTQAKLLKSFCRS